MVSDSCNLKDCFLCSSCIPEWKEAIALRKTTLHYRKGEEIFGEGDKVKGIYFLYSGFVKVHKKWTGQKDLIIRFCKSGDIVGHRGLGGDDIYPVSATAIEEAKACYIDSDFLEASLRTNHELTYRLMQVYAGELQKTENRLHRLARMEVKGRIAEALIEIQELFGTGKDKFIAVPITRQDIASYAGTTYETVFKFLTELQQTKVLVTKGKSFRINDKEKLLRHIKY